MNDPIGFAFPFRVDAATGGVAVARGSDKLRDNLRALLQTELGERVLRRDYGGGVRGLIHEPMGTAFHALLRGQIARAIARHESRVEILDLAVRPGDEPGAVVVDLIYARRASQQPERLSLSLGAP